MKTQENTFVCKNRLYSLEIHPYKDNLHVEIACKVAGVSSSFALPKTAIQSLITYLESMLK